MDKKILNIKEAIELSKKLKSEGQSIVLAGGCFDILHIGHIKFLQKAKAMGDILIILLESDEAIQKLKGIERPIHSQRNRAEILSFNTLVDYIVLLPPLNSHEYDTIVFELNPTVIATTNPDPNKHYKEKQAKKLGIKVVDVIDRIQNVSSSRIANIISKEI